MRGTILLILLGLSGCYPRIPGEWSDYSDADPDTDTDTDTDGPLACPGDDAWEDNDDASTAAEVAPPVSLDAIACAEDFDVYTFDAENGCLIDILVEFTHAAGDLDASLLENGFTVASGASVDDDEVMTWFVSEGPLAYEVFVYGYDGAENNYTLDIDVTCE